MKEILFRYRKHPGDLLRNADVIKLPNPEKELDEFLLQFLARYQSDDRIAYVNDLCKLLDNDFLEDSEKEELINMIGKKTEIELKDEIDSVEEELINEAYKNFYHLILDDKIEIILNDQK